MKNRIYAITDFRIWKWYDEKLLSHLYHNRIFFHNVKFVDEGMLKKTKQKNHTTSFQLLIMTTY